MIGVINYISKHQNEIRIQNHNNNNIYNNIIYSIPRPTASDIYCRLNKAKHWWGFPESPRITSGAIFEIFIKKSVITIRGCTYFPTDMCLWPPLLTSKKTVLWKLWSP